MDPTTRELDQDKSEGEEVKRTYRKDASGSSTPQTPRTPLRTSRLRRDSVSNNDSIDTRYATTDQELHKDGRIGVELGGSIYTSETRDYGRQDEPPKLYGDRPIHSSYRGEGRFYHPLGGDKPQPAYEASKIRDPADDLAEELQSFSMDDNYTHGLIAPHPLSPAGNADTTAYEALDSTPSDKGPTSAARSAPFSGETVPVLRLVRGTPGDREKLDSSYQKRNHDYKNFFKFGRVFATLWIEGFGNNDRGTNQTFVSEVEYKQRADCKIRRFIVVRVGERSRSVACLPVTSYGGVGHRKRGIRVEEHGFIHSKNLPKKVDGMLSRSLKVLLSPGAAHLDDTSLVNYGKVYNVETNVKVKDIGNIDADSILVLKRYFKGVYFDKGSDLPAEIEFTPLPTSAILAHVGGAAYSISTPDHAINSRDQNTQAYEASRVAPNTPRDIGLKAKHFFASEQPKVIGSWLDSITQRDAVVDPLSQESNHEDKKFFHIVSDQLAATSNNSITASSELTSPPTANQVSNDEPSIPPRHTSTRGRQAILNAIPTASRRSSLSSVLSLTFSEISKSSVSSLHSFVNQPDISQRLFEVLWLDPHLQALFKVSVTKVSLQRFEDNFRKCLLQFAKDLRAEAASSPLNKEVIQAARVVRNLSRSTASRIRNSLESANKANPDVSDTLTQNSKQHDNETEPSDDEDIKEDPSNNGLDSLKDLEIRLRESASFQLLIENLSLFLRPDLVQRSLFQIWPVTLPRSLYQEIRYEVEWAVEKFLQDCFPADQRLGEVLTLTGGTFNAQALSCQDYLRSTWPKIGSLVLDGIETLRLKRGEGKFTSQGLDARNYWLISTFVLALVQNMEASINLKYNGVSLGVASSLSITARATHAVHCDLISAISWICAAIRDSKHDTIANSSVSAEVIKLPNGSKAIFLKLCPLDPIQNSAGACWHTLFPHAVIASGFPIKNREEGKGLEISFADMSLMSRSLSFVQYDQGLIVEGLRSLLVPVADLLEDDAIQWHLMDRTKRGALKTARVSSVLAINQISSWHKDLDPQRLIERRCFLGWVTEAHVVMGAEAYSTAKIKQSAAVPAPRTRRTRSYGFTFGTSGAGFVTATATIALGTTSMPSRITFPTNQDVFDFLADGFDNHVLLFDTGARIGWCLPLLNVALYLTRLIISRRRYEMDSSKLPIFAEPSSDGAASAARVLKACLNLKVRKFQSTEEFSLSETVRQVLHSLNKTCTGLEDAMEEFDDAGLGAPRYIYGVEFIDVLKNNDSMRIRQVELNQPWAYLTKQLPIVLFGTGFGQPIVPSQPETLCDPWKFIPQGMNFLVTVATAVKTFLEEHDQGELGSRLSDHVEWLIQKPLIQSHRQGSTDAVIHLQHLRSVTNPSTLTPGISSIIRHHLKAGFIFTKANLHTQWHCSFKLQMGMLASTKIIGRLPEVPEFASATSGELSQSWDIETEPSISSHDSEEMANSDTPEEVPDRPELQQYSSQMLRLSTSEEAPPDVLFEEFTAKVENSCAIRAVPNVHKSIRKKRKLVALSSIYNSSAPKFQSSNPP